MEVVWLIYGTMPDICLEELRKTRKTCKDTRAAGGDFKARPSHHKWLDVLQHRSGRIVYELILLNMYTISVSQNTNDVETM